MLRWKKLILHNFHLPFMPFSLYKSSWMGGLMKTIRELHWIGLRPSHKEEMVLKIVGGSETSKNYIFSLAKHREGIFWKGKKKRVNKLVSLRLYISSLSTYIRHHHHHQFHRNKEAIYKFYKDFSLRSAHSVTMVGNIITLITHRHYSMASNEDDCLVDWTTESFHNGEIQLKIFVKQSRKILN